MFEEKKFKIGEIIEVCNHLTEKWFPGIVVYILHKGEFGYQYEHYVIEVPNPVEKYLRIEPSWSRLIRKVEVDYDPDLDDCIEEGSVWDHKRHPHI